MSQNKQKPLTSYKDPHVSVRTPTSGTLTMVNSLSIYWTEAPEQLAIYDIYNLVMPPKVHTCEINKPSWLQCEINKAILVHWFSVDWASFSHAVHNSLSPLRISPNLSLS